MIESWSFCPAITDEAGLTKHLLHDVDAVQKEVDIIFFRSADASVHLCLCGLKELWIIFDKTSKD